MLGILAFFHHFAYYKLIGLFAYASVFFIKKIRIDYKTLIIASSLLLYLIITIYLIPNEKYLITILNFYRYFFGFLFFYLILREHNFNINESFINLLMVLIIFEFLVINFIMPASYLPNFPICEKIWASSGCPYEYKNILNFQRAHGFGAKPSITIAILLALMINQKPKYVPELLLLTSVFLTMSGTAIIGYIIYIIFKIFNYLKLNIIIVLTTILTFFILIYSSGKFRIINFKSIIIDKLNLISENNVNILLPNLNEIKLNIIQNKFGGDAGLLSFINHFGMLSLLCFLIFFYKDIFNKKTLPQLFILFVTSFHYGAIFSLPGQITLAFILTKNYKNKENFKSFSFYNKYKKKIKIYLVPLLIIISIFMTDISSRRINKLICDKENGNCYRLNFEYTDKNIYFLF